MASIGSTLWGWIGSLSPQFLETSWKLAAYGLLFVVLESLWPDQRDQPKWRRDSWTDVICSFLVPLASFPFYIIALKGLFGVIDELGFRELLHGARQFVGAWSFPVRLVVAVVIGDFVGYWRHRAMHFKYLWPFHSVHHSPEQVDWLSNERFHPVNAVITMVLQSGVLILCGFGPVIIAWNSLIRRSYSFFIHSNLRFSYGPLDYIFVSPTFHRWHHSSDPRVRDKNFANFFSCLDLVFGTYAMPAGERPHSFGIAPARIKHDFVAQMVYPFKDGWPGRGGGEPKKVEDRG